MRKADRPDEFLFQLLVPLLLMFYKLLLYYNMQNRDNDHGNLQDRSTLYQGLAHHRSAATGSRFLIFYHLLLYHKMQNRDMANVYERSFFMYHRWRI